MNNRIFFKIIRRIIPACLCLMLWTETQGLSQWSIDPSLNTRVSRTLSQNWYPIILGDGFSGAWIAWSSSSQALDTLCLSLQRMNRSGEPIFVDGEKPVAIGYPDWPSEPKMISDGKGGVFIAWRDVLLSTSWGDIRAIRLDSSGNPRWPECTIVCPASGEQWAPVLTSDGRGGAVLAWIDSRSRPQIAIYAQRLDSSGRKIWQAEGIPLFVGPTIPSPPGIISDENGGAFVLWNDDRTGYNALYAQHVDSSGTPTWSQNGLLINGEPSCQAEGQILPDGKGGAIIVWMGDSTINLTEGNIYAQRVNSGGTFLWDSLGVPICKAPSIQMVPSAADDGAGGAYIAWQDVRNGFWETFCQHIDADGKFEWSRDGISACNGDTAEMTPAIVGDGSGGAIVTWVKQTSATESDIFAQHINSRGDIDWNPSGAAISVAGEDQSAPVIAADGAGGAIITWMDGRDKPARSIFAQHIDAAGRLGNPTSVESPRKIERHFVLYQNYPEPFNPSTTISYEVPEASSVRLGIFNLLGQEVATLVNRLEEPGAKQVLFDGSKLPSGIYFSRLRVGGHVATNKMVLIR